MLLLSDSCSSRVHSKLNCSPATVAVLYVWYSSFCHLMRKIKYFIEKANSSHSFTAGLAHSVGLRKQPLCVYSMVKYATIARGDAEIFMKFARAGYKEKIWDRAAGVVIIQEAGGMITDAEAVR